MSLRAQRDWRVCLRLKGLMAAMSPAHAKVTVSQRLYRALRWWRDPVNIRKGQTLGFYCLNVAAGPPFAEQTRRSSLLPFGLGLRALRDIVPIGM
ncbi:unnamed protein product [Boreogadus saida]